MKAFSLILSRSSVKPPVTRWVKFGRQFSDCRSLSYSPQAFQLIPNSSAVNKHGAQISSTFGKFRKYSSGPDRVSAEGIIRSPFPDRELPENKPFHEYVFKFCDQYGDIEAMDEFATGRSVTYNDIKAKSLKLASALHHLGYEKGDTIMCISINNIDFTILNLACSVLGIRFSTANPAMTPAEICHAIKVAEPNAIFTISQLIAGVQEAVKQAGNAKLRDLILPEEQPDFQGLTIQSLLDGPYTSLPSVEFDTREDIFALPFSSGTSGIPKCVQITHYNAVSNQTQRVGLTHEREGDRFLGLLPFFHIYGLVIVQFMPLEVGGFVSILPRFEPEMFLKCIQDKRLSILHLVPPLVQFLALHPIVDKYDLSSVNNILCAAAPLPPELITLVKKRFPSITVNEGFGMTESIANCITQTGADGSVGYLLPNTQGKFVDLETQQTLKQGETGEFCMKSPSIMKGYLKNPESTFATIDSEGWLHTGDVGHCEADGKIYITDRIKDLIKYKGSQVAPAEVEDVIMTHPEVADAAVVGVADERAGEVPKAFVVKKPGSNLTEDQLVDFVKELASNSKHLRGGVTFIDSVPRSPSGKILKRLLRDYQ